MASLTSCLELQLCLVMIMQSFLAILGSISLEWANPVLVEGFAYPFSGSSPAQFYAYDSQHMFGMGRNGSCAFSNESGKRWEITHPANAIATSTMLPVQTIGECGNR